MFESVTFELILQRMINRAIDSAIAKGYSIDTREGSIIYDALAPAAVELQLMYIELDALLNETFADTASRPNLIKRSAERGITPEVATKAILKGVFNLDVPIGSRFFIDSLNYVVTEKITTNQFKLQCETAGAEGNLHLGTMIPIDYIDGLTSAELTEVLINGEDDEATETLRSRYFESFDSEAFGGNVADYKKKVNELQGVGGVKVYPVWNGGGTVKCVIINSSYGKPSTTLVNDVQTAVDPVANAGKGVGLAPVGHTVTVAGVTETSVNVVLAITYQSGWVWADVKTAVEAAIDAYMIELNKTWESTKTVTTNTGLIVRISQIESRVLAVSGVLDVSVTSLNGSASNLSLGVDAIPKRGTVSG